MSRAPERQKPDAAEDRIWVINDRYQQYGQQNNLFFFIR